MTHFVGMPLMSDLKDTYMMRFFKTHLLDILRDAVFENLSFHYCGLLFLRLFSAMEIKLIISKTTNTLNTLQKCLFHR